MKRQYSFIIPVYNRPDEVEELLQSLTSMEYNDPFEVVIVEDGSEEPAEGAVRKFQKNLDIRYCQKPNTGPGDSRNYGAARAKGDYFLFLDSDCIVPRGYLREVDTFLNRRYADCFGGPDAAHPDFSPLQKAVNYAMTSWLTTGGIRGSRRSVQKFEPRSFNMGISKAAFAATGGFGDIHPGEDPDLSHRIRKAGFDTAFAEKAFVWHKRRISWKKFYQQVWKFGLVRPIITSWHPDTAKITFWLPTLFVFYTVAAIVSACFGWWQALLPLVLYIAAVFAHATAVNKSIRVGTMGVLAVFVQFFGYGWAFLRATFFIRLLKQDPEKRFPFLFFGK